MASRIRPMIPYRPPRLTPEESLARITADYEVAKTRRTVRHFSTDPVPQEIIESAIRIAGSAPSGAHRQPWHFSAISDPDLKAAIRKAAEKEEREFYHRRAPRDWLEAIAPLGTDFVKEHITDAPWLIVVFRRDAIESDDGRQLKSYYAQESVGIAIGFLISALHRAGLATLTHTPAPMTFLRKTCERPDADKPVMILPVGYPSEECVVPDLKRKSLSEIADFRTSA